MKAEKRFADCGHEALACDDILHDILLRLPEKSVFSLILVSKRWRSVICSSSFRRDYHARWRVDVHLLGFFVCNQQYLGRTKHRICRPSSERAVHLLSTCVEGDNLLVALPEKVGYFIASSNGLLLCGRHPMEYTVWNPVTKQHYQLPEPQRYYKSLCMAFFTVTEDCFNDIVHYKVIRARCNYNRSEVNTISIETFSSMTDTWKHNTLTCSSKFALRPYSAATVISGVVYWFTTQRNLAIYDPRRGDTRIVLLKFPDGKISEDYDESVLGESPDGLLQYGQSSTSGMEIWVLESEENSSSFNVQSQNKWKLRYRLGFKSMWKQNPDCGKHSKEAKLMAFLPRKPEYVFIRAGWNIYLLDLESRRLTMIRYLGRDSSIQWEDSVVVPYCRPSWPYSYLCP